ncbi:MAG: hypothetical protein PCFJNLEI_01667 [Verrucomicrobiae bacterium]|nr:hypothetical protein [Verrucomicrobiae bacterium]
MSTSYPGDKVRRFLLVLILGSTFPGGRSAHAVDFIWTNVVNNIGVSSAASSWLNGVAPTAPGAYADTFFFTNDLSAARTAIIDQSYNLANLIATNSGTFFRTIRLNNSLTLAVNGTAIIGSNTLLNIGADTTGGATFSNNNLFLQDNGRIAFNSGGTLNAGTLTVGGAFSNTPQSIISATGAAFLRFSSSFVTNAGTMSFLMASANGASGNQMLTLTAGANSNAFFVNSGTILMGVTGSSNGSRTFAFSNQFVNTSTGSLVLTNVTTTNGSHPVNVIFTGATRLSGGASTNSGTIRLVRTATGFPQPAGTLTLRNGDFVNLGTLTVNQISNTTSALILAETGSVFSNGLGGQVILEENGTGTFAIRADKIVNLGTNLINAGSLYYQGSAGNNETFLDNAGTIIFAGGGLGVRGTFTNQATGRILGTFTNTLNVGTLTFINVGTMQNSNFFNAGGLSYASGVGNIVNVSGGTVILEAGNPVMTIVTNASGGTIRASGGDTTINGFFVNQGTLIISNNTTLTFSGARNTGTILVSNAAVLNIGGSTASAANLSTMVFTNEGNINLGVGGNNAAATLNASTNGIGLFNQGIIQRGTGSASLPNSFVNAAVINGPDGTIRLATVNQILTFYSLLTNFGTVFIPAANQTITISNGNFVNNGILSNNFAGRLNIVNGSLINNGVAYFSDNGTLNGTTALLGANTITNNSYMEITRWGFGGYLLANTAPLVNNGTLVLYRPSGTTNTGDQFTSASFHNSGFVSAIGNGPNLAAADLPVTLIGAASTNQPTGTLLATNGTVWAFRGAFRNQGHIRVESNSIFATGHSGGSQVDLARFVVGTRVLNNEGTITLNDGGLLGVSQLTNVSGAVLQGNGQIGTLTFSNSFTGGAGFVVEAADILNAGTIAPNGLFNAGTITNLAGGVISGNGQIVSLVISNLSGGTNSYNTGGQIYNAAGATVLARNGTLILSNGFSAQQGTIGATNNSVLQLGGGTQALTNDGTISLVGGELRAGNLLNNSNIVMRTGNTTLTIAGTLFNPASGTLLATNTTATVTGVLSNLGLAEVRSSRLNLAGLTGTGTITNATGTLAFHNTTSTTYDGVIVGQNLLLLMAGPGTQTLAGVTSFTGGTLVSNGTLRLSGNDRLPANGTLTSRGGTLDLAGNSQTIAGAITFDGGTVQNGSLTNAGVAHFAGQSGTVSATLAGSTGLTKTGSGVLTLAGVTTYTGGTFVSNGTLRVNGSVAGAVNVYNGGTLGGTGTVAGLTTIFSGGRLAPGNSVGTNFTGGLTLLPNSLLNWEFNSTANDLTVVTNLNGLTISGGKFNLYAEGGTLAWDTAGLYKLIGYTGTVNGAVSALGVNNPVAGRIYQFSTVTGDGTAPFYVVLSLASEKFWDGGSGVDSNWQTPENWGNDTAPVEHDQLVFTGFINRLNNTNNFASGTRFSGIIFTNSAGAFTLNGNAVNLTGGIVNKSTAIQTINLPLVLDTINPVINAANGDIVIAGNISEVISEVRGITKTGNKTLILSGINTYTGNTFVNSGTLLVNGTMASAAGGIFVQSGATIGGTGIVARPLTLQTGAILAAGVPGTPGVLTISSTLTLSNDFILAWDVSTTSTDRVAASTVNFTGTDLRLQLGHSEGSVGTNAVFVLMEWTTGINTDNLTNNVSFYKSGGWNTANASVYIENNQLLLTGVYAIPEPSVLLMLIAGVVTLYVVRRRFPAASGNK